MITHKCTVSLETEYLQHRSNGGRCIKKPEKSLALKHHLYYHHLY